MRNTSKIIRGDRASRTSRLLLLDLELTIWASERVNSGRATMLLLEADRYQVWKWPLGKPDLPRSQWYFSDVPYRESNVRNEVCCPTSAFSAAQPEPDGQLAAPNAISIVPKALCTALKSHRLLRFTLRLFQPGTSQQWLDQKWIMIGCEASGLNHQSREEFATLCHTRHQDADTHTLSSSCVDR